MNRNRSIERLLFACPEVDSADHSVYPLVSPEEFMVLEQAFCEDTSQIYLYPFVRQTEAGMAFVDLYVWDIMLYPDRCRRFVISEGYRLPEEEEEAFLSYTGGRCRRMDDEWMKDLNTRIMRLFPDWHYISYSPFHLGSALQHMYYVSHRSGAREILYKAGLNYIADCLDDIPSYNLLGTDPQTIIGFDLPLRLLRILNQPALVSKLMDEESILECADVYRKYGGYIGRKLPSRGQWNYLEALFRNGGTFGGNDFLRALYDRLSVPGSEYFLNMYEHLLELRNEIPGIRKIGIPKPDDVTGMVEKLDMIRERRSGDRGTDALFRERKHGNGYEYTGSRYVVIMPDSTADLCEEAIIQGNCLMEYIDDHVSANTTILFLRKRDQQDQPFVTIEVKGRVIEQVRGRFNSLPEKEVFVFLQEYAKKHWLVYDPYRLIAYRPDVDEPECDEELWEYAEAFRKRNYPVQEDDAEEQNFVQMTLEECFPEMAACY